MKVLLAIIYNFLQLIIASLDINKHKHIQVRKLETWMCSVLFMILHSFGKKKQTLQKLSALQIDLSFGASSLCSIS